MIAGVVLVVLAVAAFAFFGDSNAEVGDCVKTTDANSDEVEVVDCDDDAALAKVIGIADDEVSYGDFLAKTVEESCADFPDSVGAFWQGNEGEDGEVVCVGSL